MVTAFCQGRGRHFTARVWAASKTSNSTRPGGGEGQFGCGQRAVDDAGAVEQWRPVRGTLDMLDEAARLASRR